MSMVERCDFSPGQIIDNRYKIIQKLGEGAFGMVFRVSDVSGQTFALKILKLWEVSPDIRKHLIDRFDMEFQTGQIDSPYLVSSIEHGFVSGNPYILMEFCPNGDLTRLPSDTDWNYIGQQVLLGLKALHQCGKVHRDLKPENVLVKQDGSVALTDFGISGDRNKRMTERNIFGKPQQIFGTYAYMPPEQVNPHRDATVLPTTDIFSFGVMMYQLLTGALPFGPLTNDNELVRYQKAGKEGRWDCAPLSRSPYGTIYIPVIEGCLQPDFHKRLQSADDVLALMPTIHQSLPHPSKSLLPVKPTFIQGYLLRVMHGDDYGKIYNLNVPVITIGRYDYGIDNTISIREDKSCYISRRHCTIHRIKERSKTIWQIFDGQQGVHSTNGTYVNSVEVGQYGYYLQHGDIISIGDTKLRFEAF